MKGKAILSDEEEIDFFWRGLDLNLFVCLIIQVEGGAIFACLYSCLRVSGVRSL